MHLIRLTRSSRPLFRRGYRVLYGETSRVHIFSRRPFPGERGETTRSKEEKWKKRFCFTIPLSSRRQYHPLSNIAHDAFVYHSNDILILLLFTNELSRFYRKNDEIKRGGPRAGNVESTGFIRRVDFNVFVVRTFGLKSDRLQRKTRKKIMGHKPHVREI